MRTRYTRSELANLDTIMQAWDGDKLVIEDDGYKVWLTHPENRLYNRDYTVEMFDPIDGKWIQESYYFDR